MSAFHLVAALYLAVCALLGGGVGAACGVNTIVGAIAGALVGALVARVSRRAVLWALPPVRPPCERCNRTDFEMAAFRFRGTTEILENGVTLDEDGSLWRCQCGCLYFQTPRRLGTSTRFLIQTEDGRFQSYMRSTRFWGRWLPDGTPNPSMTAYRS